MPFSYCTFFEEPLIVEVEMVRHPLEMLCFDCSGNRKLRAAGSQGGATLPGSAPATRPGRPDRHGISATSD
jgi:hypothetical protein